MDLNMLPSQDLNIVGSALQDNKIAGIKRPYKDDSEENENASLKNILLELSRNMSDKLNRIEKKLEVMDKRLAFLEENLFFPSLNNANAVVNGYDGHIKTDKEDVFNPALRKTTGGVIMGYQGLDESACTKPAYMTYQTIEPNVTLITLNSEEEYPNGSWLGDETNPEMRVRVGIAPSDLQHLHATCRTPEKMALALLDFLFDRDTQAMSNLSGMGKHGKKQLDPLLIYSIRCHLIHRFNIGEDDWRRIRLNIDSKCRTAFRRKVRGMPLTVKAFKGKSLATYIQVSESPSANSCMENSSEEDATISFQIDESDLQVQPQVDEYTSHITLTNDQLLQLQQSRKIRIIPANQISFQTQLSGSNGVTLTMSPSEAMRLIGEESTDEIEISSEMEGSIIPSNPS